MVCCLRTLPWFTIVAMVAFGLLELAFRHDQDLAPLCLPAHTGRQHWSLSVYWDCLSPPSSSQAVSSSPLSLLHISLPGLPDLLLPRALPLRGRPSLLYLSVAPPSVCVTFCLVPAAVACLKEWTQDSESKRWVWISVSAHWRWWRKVFKLSFSPEEWMLSSPPHEVILSNTCSDWAKHLAHSRWLALASYFYFFLSSFPKVA